MNRQRFVVFRVPEWTPEGKLARVRYFTTATAAKVFAKEQAKTLGHGGYTWESLTAENVAQLLADHIPADDYPLKPRQRPKPA